MGFNTPFISLGVDASTGKSYHLCSAKSLLLFAMIIMLVLSMATERVMFKTMVDRMPSYRYFLCQVMTFIYIPPLFCIVGYKSTQDEFIEEELYEFPKVYFFVMGILDLMHAMMLFIAGGKTEPMQTLLLMQASIPVAALFSAIFFRTRYSRLQVLGTIVIVGGLFVSFVPIMEDFNSPNFEDREVAWNTLAYLLAAIPGALSMLYKERAIRDQPMDMFYLNAWVAVYQFVGGLVLAPLLFDIEQLHLLQKMSGLECLINGKSEDSSDQCHLGLLILCAYILSNVLLNFLMLQVIRLTGVSVISRSTLLGFVVSFVMLAWYELAPSDFGVQFIHKWLSSTTFALDLIAFFAVVIGKVLYEWDPDPDMEATTTSAQDKEAQSLLSDEEFGVRYT